MSEKKTAQALMCLISILLLAGCGKKEWTGEDVGVTTLGIDRDGRVLEIVVEDFGESYYDCQELRGTIESEIADYVSEAGSPEDEPPVVLNDVSESDNRVRTSILYQTPEDYGAFTQETLYYGTLRQAGLRGFEMPSVLTDAEGASYTIRDEDANRHVIFTDGHDHIVTPYKIIACTKGVILVSETEADFSGTEKRAALLLAK